MPRETGSGGVGAYLKQRVEAAGGLCEKLKFEARRGPPDYLVTLPSEPMELVETKWSNDAPVQAHQRRDHVKRAKCGIIVRVLLDKRAVDIFMTIRGYNK